MAAYFNLNNNEISKNLLVNKFNMILDNQGSAMPNDQKILLSDEPQRSISWFVQKQPPEVFSKKAVLKKFANFTRKHLCWNLFSVKLQAFSPATILKKDSNTGVYCEIFEIFQNVCCEETSTKDWFYLFHLKIL